MKRTISLILTVVFGLPALSGCGFTTQNSAEPAQSGQTQSDGQAAAGEPTASDAKVNIRFLNRWAADSNLGAPVQKAVNDFMAEHPNVTISTETIGGTDDVQFYEKMRTAAATGDMYELFQNYGGSTIRSYVDSGILLDLTDAFAADPAWRDSFQPLFSMWEYPDKAGTYGLPLTSFANILFCNKDLFEQHGLSYPKTISEFEAVCDAFLAKGIVPVPLSGEGWRSAHLASGLVMRRFGKELIFQLADRSKKYTDPEMMEILSLIKSWQDKGYFGSNIASLDSATEQAMFSGGRSPMIAIGTWQPENVLANNPERIDNKMIDIVWFPYFESNPELKGGTMGGPNEGLAIGKKDPATDEMSLALLKYLTSAEVVTDLWQSAPTNLFAVKTATVPADLNYLTADCVRLINESATDMMQEVTSYDSIASLQDRLRNSLAGMIAGGTPEAALQEVQDEIDSAS